MSTQTLFTIRSTVASITDVEIGAQERFTVESVNLMIQETVEQYWMLVNDSGDPQRLRQTTLTTSSSTTSSNGWPANQYVSLPSDFMSLKSAAITRTNGVDDQLEVFAGSDADSEYWFPPYIRDSGTPRMCKVASDSNDAPILRLKPAADAAYTVKITYIPGPPTLDDDADTVQFVPGTSDWVIADVALKILETNDDIGPQAQALQARKNKAEQVLRQHASRQNRAGPVAWGSVGRRSSRRSILW